MGMGFGMRGWWFTSLRCCELVACPLAEASGY